MAKIFLDDLRPFPSQDLGYSCVRDYNSCIILLDLFKDNIEFISLDYDLQSDYTGLDALVYMHNQLIFPHHINIHSDHQTGKKAMLDFAKAYFPNAFITTNKVPTAVA